jgi:hypothetical protein
MTSTPQAEYRVVASMDTSRPMGGNMIHSDQGAKDYGFRSALVVGGYVYGWTAPVILEVLGREWLSHGWASINFRRPTYVGDEMTARISRREDGVCELTMQNQKGESCLYGEVGLGNAAWLADLVVPARITPEARPESRPPLTLEAAPVGQDLRPLSSRVGDDASLPYVNGTTEEENPLWSGPGSLVHPGWVVGRMTGLALHSYTFSPSIAAAIRIQHLREFRTGQTIKVAGHFRDAYERNGHHYSVIDGLLLDEQGSPVVEVQQTTIFKVARR